jgi:hypothetical protein
MQHICHHCKHKYPELTMQRVSFQDGDYRMWTPAREEWFKAHHKKYPPLVWICAHCATSPDRPPAAPRRA